jgi:hypothetical protein
MPIRRWRRQAAPERLKKEAQVTDPPDFQGTGIGFFSETGEKGGQLLPAVSNC